MLTASCGAASSSATPTSRAVVEAVHVVEAAAADVAVVEAAAGDARAAVTNRPKLIIL